MKTPILILLILASTLATNLFAQQPGDLDNSFGINGIVTTDIDSAAWDAIKELAIQPDGKIVAVGFSEIISTSHSLVVARYQVNGTLDSTFGTNGIVTSGGIIYHNYYQDCSVALQPDGKIIVSGVTNYLTLVRYNSDGSLDTTFGLNGEVINDSMHSPISTLIQTDGKIVACGTKLDGIGNYFTLARYNTDGTLDSSFGSGGLAHIDFPDPEANSMVIQPDGKIIVGGKVGDQWPDFASARFNTDGSPDTTFGTNGKVTTDFGGWDELGSLVLQPDGKIVAVGWRLAAERQFAAARYNPNGSIDSSFGTNGLVTNHVGTWNYNLAFSGALQSDGKIIAAGYSENTDTINSYFALTRYNVDGSLDNDFGTGGTLITDIGWGTQMGGGDIVRSIIIQPDGKIVAAGASDWRFALARYWAEEQPGTCFASFTYTNSGNTYTFQNTSTGGDLSYTWDFGDGTTLTTVNPIHSPVHTYAAGTYNVCLFIHDTTGINCGDTTSCATIHVAGSLCNASFTYSVPIFPNIYTFQNTSTGSSLSYLWDFGNGDTTTQENPVYGYIQPGSYNVCLTITDTSGCTDSTCSTITIINQDLVWPGDANSDGIANVWDVLAIGIGYGNSGPARQNATTTWVGQPCTDWQLQFLSGVNLKHADCDGNAVIDSNDVNAISLNYGLVHAKSSESGLPTDPPLYVDLPDTLYAGQTVSAPINLGSASNIVIGIYGIAFGINYDTDIVDTNSVDVSYDNSWMGTAGVDLLGFSKDFYPNAKTDVAITRINHVNAAQNYGQIGTFTFTIKDDVSGKRLLDVPFEISIDNITAIDKDENIIPVSGERDSSVVVMIESGVMNVIAPFVRIYPNPADEKIHVEASEPINKIILTDMLGRIVQIEIIRSEKTTLDIQSLPKGVYLLRLEFENATEYRKLLVQD